MTMRPLILGAACAALLAAASHAAETPRRPIDREAPSPPPAARQNWTGAYFGLNAGYARGSDETRDLPARPRGAPWDAPSRARP